MPRAPRYAVVMAGGAGTRFWPRSRSHVPKQFLPITGTRTMLQETVARVTPPVEADRVLVVVGRAHAKLTRQQLGPRSRAQVLVEPQGRNTAAAIALAATYVARADPGAVLFVLPADHAIPALGAFRADLALAARVAERTGALVTLGIPPTGPETGYGYIRSGRRLSGQPPRVTAVEQFIEKPTAKRAAALLATRRVLWNAGIFAWRVDVILEQLRQHLPEVLEPIERAVARGTAAALRAAYRSVPAISIDYGVMERASQVAVVRARFGWSDVGSWAAVEPFWRTNGAGNAARGRVVAVDATGCVVDTEKRLVALLGVRDLVIVDTPDAIMVCPKSQAQDVRRLVDAVRRQAGERFL